MEILSPALAVVLALALGAGLGTVHFGGLWWTLRLMETARRPGLLCLASFVARIGFTAAVLALLARGGWELMAAALVGFVAVRSLGFRRVRRSAEASRPGGNAA